MHDITYANKIITVLKSNFQGQDFKKHIVVNIALGALTHVTADTLREAFEPLAKKEGFVNTELFIEKINLAVNCGKCGATTEISEPVFACPACGDSGFKIVHTEEFLIKSIEIKD